MQLPEDPVLRLAAIKAAIAEFTADLEEARQMALFEARMEGRFDDAVDASGLSRKRALAATRRENEARGRQVRWGDGN